MEEEDKAALLQLHVEEELVEEVEHIQLGFSLQINYLTLFFYLLRAVDLAELVKLLLQMEAAERFLLLVFNQITQLSIYY